MSSERRYSNLTGKHPKERTEIYVERLDLVTKQTKTIPAMVDLFTNRRHRISLHRLLEIDWWACRQAAQQNTRQKMVQRMNGWMDPVYPINPTFHSLPPLPVPAQKQSKTGFMQQAIPQTVFEGPFQSVIPVQDSNHTKRRYLEQFIHPVTMKQQQQQ